MQSTLDAIKEEEEEFHSNDLSFNANSVGTKKLIFTFKIALPCRHFTQF